MYTDECGCEPAQTIAGTISCIKRSERERESPSYAATGQTLTHTQIHTNTQTKGHTSVMPRCLCFPSLTSHTHTETFPVLHRQDYAGTNAHSHTDTQICTHTRTL